MSTPQPPGIPDQPATAPPPVATPDRKEEGLEEDRPSTWQPWLYVKIGLLLLLVIWGILFVVENNREINVHFVFATARVNQLWGMLLLVTVGLVGGVLLSQLYRHRRRAQLTKKGRKSRDPRGDVVGRDKAEGKAR